MSRAERLHRLLEMLIADGGLDTEDAAHRLTVSAATIRRDLDHLADQQLLTRTHGGAAPNATSYDLPMRYRTTARAEAKVRIARAAAAMVAPGSTVALNGGTTTLEIARAIATEPRLHSGVTLITNAINIAAELAVRPFIKIIVSGGVARPQSFELVGPLATSTLDRLTADVCFLGAAGLDVESGITAADETEAEVNRLLVQRSRRTVVTVDGNKLGRTALCRICTLAEVDAVLVDAGTDRAALAPFADRVEVITA